MIPPRIAACMTILWWRFPAMPHPGDLLDVAMSRGGLPFFFTIADKSAWVLRRLSFDEDVIELQRRS